MIVNELQNIRLSVWWAGLFPNNLKWCSLFTPLPNLRTKITCKFINVTSYANSELCNAYRVNKCDQQRTAEKTALDFEIHIIKAGRFVRKARPLWGYSISRQCSMSVGCEPHCPHFINIPHTGHNINAAAPGAAQPVENLEDMILSRTLGRTFSHYFAHFGICGRSGYILFQFWLRGQLQYSTVSHVIHN